jgi:hypothetical protein
MYLNELCYKNNIDFAKDSGFEVGAIDRINYKDYVGKDAGEQTENILRMLEARA